MSLDISRVTGVLDDLIASGAIMDAIDAGRPGVVRYMVDRLHDYLMSASPPYRTAFEAVSVAKPGSEEQAKRLAVALVTDIMTEAGLWPPIDVLIQLWNAIPAELRRTAKAAVAAGAAWKDVLTSPSLQNIGAALTATADVAVAVAEYAYYIATDAALQTGRLAKALAIYASQWLANVLGALTGMLGGMGLALLDGITNGGVIDTLLPGGSSGPLSDEGLLGVPGVPII